MYNFASDYLEGAHPQVMEALNKTNFIQTVGYGEDEYCQKAKDKIKNNLYYTQIIKKTYDFS